ncbi:TPA: hypothetical protein HA281_01725 [Candidatus Woesearchaeota archaeon]|nr:hypothetical protein [Candidatus Woesearchaeota archaeon]HIH91497.1 hypothetical protein [Candidatus Woesearchaeota archaeon]HII63893.1 hypothetical protein [Candidatus Woesearchaeota archaeon]HIJ18595.1 hypothetical protein [Candidatus Woesearchaeota archaeon]
MKPYDAFVKGGAATLMAASVLASSPSLAQQRAPISEWAKTYPCVVVYKQAHPETNRPEVIQTMDSLADQVRREAESRQCLYNKTNPQKFPYNDACFEWFERDMTLQQTQGAETAAKKKDDSGLGDIGTGIEIGYKGTRAAIALMDILSGKRESTKIQNLAPDYKEFGLEKRNIRPYKLSPSDDYLRWPDQSLKGSKLPYRPTGKVCFHDKDWTKAQR